MAQTIEPDFPAPALEGDEAATGWFLRAVRHLLPSVTPAEGTGPRERNGPDPDPTDLPPSWFLT